MQDMCLNGVVFADLKWKPAAYEIRNVQAPVQIRMRQNIHAGRKIWTLCNDYHTLSLNHLYMDWELQCDGNIVEKGRMEMPQLEAGCECPLCLPHSEELVSGEAYLNIYVRYKEASFFAPTGEELYHVQIPVQKKMHRIHQRRTLVPSEDGSISIRLILDRFSVEAFVNDGRQVLLAVLYTDQAADGISFSCRGQARVDVEKYDLI